MLNRIRNLQIVNHRLDPHETELRVHVEVESLSATTQIKGRLVGPRSAYAATVEIAYPLREVARTDRIEMRVVIPEACWWEPKTPFLYHGAVELWQDHHLCERTPITHGIRTARITPKGLTLNGHPFVLRGKAVASDITEDDLWRWHAEGFNAVMISQDIKDFALISSADRYGIFIVHRSAKGIGWNLHGIDPSGAEILLHQEDESAVPSAMPRLILTKKLPTHLPQQPDVIGWIEST